MVGDAAAYRRHLAVRSWVVVRPSKIAPTRKDLSVAHNHGTERRISLPGFIQGNAHEPFILS
jgi:hypothetical protein